MIHPELAAKKDIANGDTVTVSSRVGEVFLPAQVSDEMMPNVVSIPHGWGHHPDRTEQKIAREHAGVSVNDLTDEQLIDELCGNAAVNGVPVQVVKA